MKSYNPFISEIGIAAWNLNGFQQTINSFKYNKLHNQQVLDILTVNKIFCLIETHHRAEDVGALHIEHFKCHSVCRPKSRNVKRYKPSGGLAVYIHTSIQPEVRIMSEPGTESIIIKLKKEYFSQNNDIYVCFAYCVPSNSNVLHREFMPDDIWDDLQAKLAKYDAQGDIILLGDLNSRTHNLPDFIQGEDNQHLPAPPLYTIDTIGTFDRFNIDQKVNSYGRKFIELCRSVPLRILNGRKLGDLMGNFTCINSRGSSAVDYGAVSPSLFHKVSHFQVHHLMPEVSDHTPISLGLRVNARLEPPRGHYNFLPKPDKVVWNKEREQAFRCAVQSPDCQEAMMGFLATGIMPNQASVDQAAEFITNILKHSAELSGMPVKKGAVPRHSAWTD